MSDVIQPTVGSLGDYLDNLYRAKTRPIFNRQVDQVGTTPVQIAPNDPKRVGITVINLSSSTLYVAFSNLVSSSRGILLTQNGGSLNLVPEHDFDLVGWEMWAVAGAANSDLYVIEVVLR